MFSSREDAIPDQRVETLLEIMADIFGAYSRALGEAAVQLVAIDQSLEQVFAERELSERVVDVSDQR